MSTETPITGSTAGPAARPVSSIAFADELGDYCSYPQDEWIEVLRQINGVPNATYVVENDRVFVFDKLVHRVQKSGLTKSSGISAHTLDSLIKQATVSANEAVEVWGIIPEQYEVIKSSEGALRIRHRPFNALLPGAFETLLEVQAALANLLLGGVQPGEGDFSYKGQPLTLMEPLDVALLPSRPIIDGLQAIETDKYISLNTVEYLAGFAPVSKSLFDEVKALETRWKADSSRAAKYAYEHADALWGQVGRLHLDTLNRSDDKVPEYGKTDVQDLRGCFPELGMLSDDSLYARYNKFQWECYSLNGWEAHRENAFLFYLIGKTTGDWDKPDFVGQCAGYAILCAEPITDALAFGTAAGLYEEAISHLAYRIADVMRFLQQDTNEAGARGPAVTTMLDLVRSARSVRTE